MTQIFSDPWTYVAIYFGLMLLGGVTITKKLSAELPATNTTGDDIACHLCTFFILALSPALALAYVPYKFVMRPIANLLLDDAHKNWR